MKRRMLLSLGLCLCFLFTVKANIVLPNVDHTGTYEFVVSDIPDQPDVKGTMVVSKTGDEVKVKFSSEVGEIYLSNTKLEGDKLSGKIDVQGIVLNLRGTFSDDGFEGQFNTEYGAMGISATKK
ncbi:MAG: hypothetical protein AAGJ18_29170 [Bacteroidota bacterium]